MTERSGRTAHGDLGWNAHFATSAAGRSNARECRARAAWSERTSEGRREIEQRQRLPPLAVRLAAMADDANGLSALRWRRLDREYASFVLITVQPCFFASSCQHREPSSVAGLGVFQHLRVRRSHHVNHAETGEPRSLAFLKAAALPPARRAPASSRPNSSISFATTPVHPVWWLAPMPAPLSPWKYS